MNRALIVIDAQEDFTYGVLGTPHAIEALPVITKVVDLATEKGMNIYYTRDTHVGIEKYKASQEGRVLPVPHCIIDTDGWRLCREVLPRDFDKAIIINKRNFGTMEWKMQSTLGGQDEIWLCGFCTDVCVMSNFQIIKALFPDIPIVIIKDACAGTTPELHNAALKVMESCQAMVSNYEDVEVWP